MDLSRFQAAADAAKQVQAKQEAEAAALEQTNAATKAQAEQARLDREAAKQAELTAKERKTFESSLVDVVINHGTRQGWVSDTILAAGKYVEALLSQEDMPLPNLSTKVRGQIDCRFVGQRIKHTVRTPLGHFFGDRQAWFDDRHTKALNRMVEEREASEAERNKATQAKPEPARQAVVLQEDGSTTRVDPEPLTQSLVDTSYAEALSKLYNDTDPEVIADAPSSDTAPRKPNGQFAPRELVSTS